MKNHWLEKKEEQIREEFRAEIEQVYLTKLREATDLFRMQLENGFDEAWKMCEATRARAEAAEEENRSLRLLLLVTPKKQDASNR